MPGIAAAGITIAAVVTMFLAFRRGIISRTLLASMVLLYFAFIAWLVVRHLI